MAMSEYSAYSSLQANSNAKFATGLRVGAHLALTDLHPEDPSELLHME